MVGMKKISTFNLGMDFTNKILFLDIDGVLTSGRTGYQNWDIYSTTFLKWLCEKTNTKIVVSSTWRCNRDRKFFTDIFGDDIIHNDWKTPWDLLDFTINCRGDEIKKWLDKHPEITEYVILDDDNDFLEEHQEHLVLTNSQEGMSYKDTSILGTKLGLTKEHVCNMNLLKLIQHPNMFSEKSVEELTFSTSMNVSTDLFRNGTSEAIETHKQEIRMVLVRQLAKVVPSTIYDKFLTFTEYDYRKIRVDALSSNTDIDKHRKFSNYEQLEFTVTLKL